MRLKEAPQGLLGWMMTDLSNSIKVPEETEDNSTNPPLLS